MTDALFTQLSSIIKPSTMAEIGNQLGVPETSVARGLALSGATAFAGLANKAGDSDAMRQIIDTASRTPADAIASGVSRGQLTDPNSLLMSTGRRVLSSLFGGGTSNLTDAIGREAGLGSGVTATLMSLGASALLSLIGRRVRDEGMTASSLASFLNHEAPGVRATLPPALDDALRSPVARTFEVNPVVAQTVRKERSWLPWLAVPAVLAAALWFGSRPRSVPMPEVPTVGTTGTMPATAPEPTTGVNLDRRLLFDTGSSTVQPGSRAELQSIAVIMKAHPDARCTIAGYTDDVGSAAANLALSRQRADQVKKELIAMGVDGSHLTAEGYGEAQPVGANSTEAGRAMNRRISIHVAEK
jgi:outer membrane protein OmpA-like peptidoglycan-associated protein